MAHHVGSGGGVAETGLDMVAAAAAQVISRDSEQSRPVDLRAKSSAGGGDGGGGSDGADKGVEKASLPRRCL